MERVLVIGCPGSGKSTFARRLSHKTHLPLYHLDCLYWTEEQIPRETYFQKELKMILRQKEWIIDGHYKGTLEERLKRCDTVFFLDYQKEVCLDGIIKRRGKKRVDLPFIEGEEIDKNFWDFVQSFAEKERPGILKMLKIASEHCQVYTFTTREEGDNFLKQMDGENSVVIDTSLDFNKDNGKKK